MSIKKQLGFIGVICFVLLSVTGCKRKAAEHPWTGTFTNAFGTRFELRPDSSCTITFKDTIRYDGVWKFRDRDSVQYVNIEFAGNYNYYYLHKGKIYRDFEQMLKDSGGIEIEYQE